MFFSFQQKKQNKTNKQPPQNNQNIILLVEISQGPKNIIKLTPVREELVQFNTVFFFVCVRVCFFFFFVFF